MKNHSKQEAKKGISELVTHFEKNIQSFKSSNTKEAQIENDFIRPLFGYLNWNISNIGLEPEKQVFQLQVTGKTGDDFNKRPDYLLRVPVKETNQMKSVFFIEAKKPIYNLKTNTKYLRQVYQYAWSTLNSSDNPNNQVRLALLTDFEEFRFFDCQDASPLQSDKYESFNKHIIKDWTYKDYINKFDELWDIFEYNNVVAGSLEKWYLTSKQLADNRITPDKKFLEDLRDWRLTIARIMYKNDKSLDDFQLTKATLIFINRIIFVKMLADRDIEPDYLKNILSELSISKKSEVKLYNLCENIFKRLDHIYNGSIFAYDKDTDEIHIENNILRKIFEELKPENSIYTLAAMPVEIIGNVYELIIAEQIVKKGTGIAIVPKYDEKKAGGVYYTPRYIVEYIVDNTLGKKLEECKTPAEVAKIKILDPACGSGSFLIVAYQKLIDWHKKWYYNELLKFTKKDNISKFRNKSDKQIRIMLDGNSDYYTIHLSHKLKSEILINNIFGVDIDQQAVLVTKFSLSIKALEDSTHDEVIEDNSLYKLPAIPMLENNVKCGNSLIESDFYQDNRPSLFNEKEKRKINTFDWEREFPDVFKYKEQDAKTSIIKKIDTHINSAVNYLDGAIYHTEKVSEYVNDLINLQVKDNTNEYNAISRCGFDVIIGNPPYVDYRAIDGNQIKYLIDNYISTKVKEKWSLFIPFLEKSAHLLNSSGRFGFIIPNNFLVADFGLEIRKFLMKNVHINRVIDVSKFNVFGKVSTYPVLFFFQLPFHNDNKIEIGYPKEIIDLENCEFNRINQSLLNSQTNKYQISTSISRKSFNILDKISFKAELLKNLCTKFIWGTSIVGFKDYKISSDEYKILNIKEQKKYSKVIQTADIKRYLIDWQEEYITNSIYSDNVKNEFNKEKIVIARLTKNLQATVDNEKYFLGKSSLMTGIKINPYYLLAILNSKVINYFYNIKYENTHMRGGYLRFDIPYLSQLPIHSIDFSNKSEKVIHDKLVKLVGQMLENQKYIYVSKTESDKKIYKNISEQLDEQIDSLVYELYGLTEEEIKIVEA